MNYQPFFDMNILVSDHLLDNKFALFLLVILSYYAFFFIHMSLYSFLRLMRRPARPYLNGSSND